MRRDRRPLILVAAESDEGMRLDRFLRERSSVLSRMFARDLLAAGGVTLNGKRVKIASRPLRAGDRVEVHVLAREHRSTAPPGMEPFRVVHEDAAVLVVDKAPGVLVQPTRQGDRGTLLDLLSRYLRRRFPEVRSPYLGLLHRIDRETSGLLLFSRRGSANRILADQFRTHAIAREYVALVRGSVPADSGTISDPLHRAGPGLRRRSLQGPRGAGKEAVTHFRVLERWEIATLLALRLETGRTHQIRIHLSERGHPVIGDKVYSSTGPFPPNPLLDRFPRHALHARRLGFTHPVTGQWMEFESPLPDDFAGLLISLRAGFSAGGTPASSL
ncbi:MAG TPA: RluA family pseudouridine synthase [Candidatus Polarisedimenticolia bacterium]|jgi:23S rRNA pseudouridine1911/1915/1917 synthase|nr:RluA family pseudouridine synthase [Candidatus Polarisedimenticolia bacterium]